MIWIIDRINDFMNKLINGIRPFPSAGDSYIYFTCVSHAKSCIVEAKSVCDREQEIDRNQTKNKEKI